MIMSRRMRWRSGSTNRGEEEREEKPEGRRTLGRSRRRRVDNIKVDLEDIGWGGVEWIDRGQDRDQWRALVNSVMKLPVP
jgi:hypothetical protein